MNFNSGSAMNKPISIAIVGAGKIAGDQHVPAISQHPGFNLVASVDREPGKADFQTLEALLDARPTQVDAVAISTPPQHRYAIAELAIKRGLHVLLEKPPAQTVGQVEKLKELAAAHRVALYAAWHSRHAPFVPRAREWLNERQIKEGSIVWREDVNAFHPGQDWLRQREGLGVFDPGINALSILTTICPQPVTVESAVVRMPPGWESPKAALLRLTTGGAPITAEFEFREEGLPQWNIELRSASGNVLVLSAGGHGIAIDGVAQSTSKDSRVEYNGVYDQFARLIEERRIDADASPLALVEDALRLAAAGPISR